jgi:hypothetical protein
MIALCGSKSVGHKPMQECVVCDMHQHRSAGQRVLYVGEIVSGSCHRYAGCRGPMRELARFVPELCDRAMIL